MQSNAWIWWVVAAIIIIGGGYWLLQGSATPEAAPNGAAGQTQLEGTPSPADDGTTVGVDASVGVNTAPMSATVTFDGTAFSPSSVTVKQGGSVTFTSTAGTMWVASGPHPEHTGYGSTSRSVHCAAGYTGATPFDQCVAGTTYTFTFNKTGTWPYHNHIKAGVFGSVTVVQ